jgi:outer membrane protein, heavy metal efflux system
MLRRGCVLLLLGVVGCHALPAPDPLPAPGTLAQPAVPETPCESDAADELDLAQLWRMARRHHPELQEAAADVEVARGQALQARTYPNPRLAYQQDTIGSRIARQGNATVLMNQEIVTAGKRRLDQAVAERETDVSVLALRGRRFDVLTRVRRAYYETLNLQETLRVQQQTLAALEAGLKATRQLVEQARTRPATDLLALEGLIEEARINQAKTQTQLAAAWKQLAAEVGAPDLERPGTLVERATVLPAGDVEELTALVLNGHSSLVHARLEADSARLAWQRARAEAVPNVTVGAGYSLDNTDQTAGGLVNVELALPFWDRKQGQIRQAEARYHKAQAAVRSAELRLRREVIDAWARYQSSRQQIDRLDAEVLPRLQKRLDLLRQGLQAGAAQVSFSDVLMTEQSLLSSRLTRAEARRELWRAVADLQGLLQEEADVQ